MIAKYSSSFLSNFTNIVLKLKIKWNPFSGYCCVSFSIPISDIRPLLYIKSIFKKYPPKTRHIKNYPHVSVVVAARDEAETIERRIRNIENQDYPKTNSSY